MKKLISLMLVLGLIFSMAIPTLAWEDEDNQEQVVAQAEDVELEEVEIKEEKTLPGDFLYPLKRLGETIRLAVSFNEQTRARLLSQYAERRLDELHTLVANGKDTEALVDELLASFSSLIKKLEDKDQQAILMEQYGISAEKIEQIIRKAEKKQALVAKLALKHLELSEEFEGELEKILEEADNNTGLEKALQNATRRFERSQSRIQERLQIKAQEMQGEGDDDGLQAMEQLHQRFQNKLESIKNKINERANNRRGGKK